MTRVYENYKLIFSFQINLFGNIRFLTTDRYGLSKHFAASLHHVDGIPVTEDTDKTQCRLVAPAVGLAGRDRDYSKVESRRALFLESRRVDAGLVDR